MEKKALLKRIQALEEQVDFLKLIADYTHDCELFHDNTGKIIYINRAFKKITGYNAEDFLSGKISIVDFVHPEDLKKTQNGVEKSLKGKKRNDITFRIIRKDGKVRILNAYSKPVYIKKQFQGFRSSVRDITSSKALKDLKIAKENAENKRQLLEKMAEHFPNSFISIIEKDYTIGFTSGAEFKNRNLDPKDFIGLNIKQVLGKNTPLIKKYYKKTFKGEETVFELNTNEQYHIYRSYPMIDETGKINQILAIVENVTEHREQALRETELVQKKLDGLHLKLKHELDFNNKLIDDMVVLRDTLTPEIRPQMQLLINRFKTKKTLNNWTEFDIHFEKINESFYKTLSLKYPHLTRADLRLCGLLKHNLSLKEISGITLKTENSLKKATQRLRKKLEIEKNIKLSSFLNQL